MQAVANPIAFNASISVIETMQKGAGITEARPVELKGQVSKV